MAPDNRAFKSGSSVALYREPMKETHRMRLIALALAATGLALVGSVGMAQPRTTILPGQWVYDYKIGPIPAGSDERCLKPADVEIFAKGICLKRYTCDYDTRVVADGRIALKGRWIDKKGRVAPVTAKGSYTPEAFRLNVNGRTVNGLPMIASMDARRISATCAPDSK